jgi:hypothetical protein
MFGTGRSRATRSQSQDFKRGGRPLQTMAESVIRIKLGRH